MAVKPIISRTDDAHEFATSLVARGKFASLSAVVQHGLRLVEREEEEHKVRLDAIRADLDRRSARPSIPTEEMDARIAAWRAERDRIGRRSGVSGRAYRVVAKPDSLFGHIDAVKLTKWLRHTGQQLKLEPLWRA